MAHMKYPVDTYSQPIKRNDYQFCLHGEMEILPAWREMEILPTWRETFSRLAVSAGSLFVAIVRRGVDGVVSTASRGANKVAARRAAPRMVHSEMKIGKQKVQTAHTIQQMPTPQYSHKVNTHAYVKVPLLQSVVSSGFAFAVVSFGMITIDHYTAVTFAFADWVINATGAALITFGIAWWKRSGNLNPLLYAVEQVTGLDIDGDGQTGQPVSIPRSIPFHSRNGKNQRVDVPISNEVTSEEWSRLAHLVLSKRVNFARRDIVAASKDNRGMHISQSLYGKMLKALDRAGFLDGNKLNEHGEGWLSAYLSPTPAH